MILSIHIILLLFALGTSAHSHSRIQIKNGSDIYQIRVKPNRIFEIIEPKTKVPTLREIIYFKIKEMPYQNRLEKEKEPDFDDRPYTNGPGFQFLDYGPTGVQKSNEDDKNSKNDSSNSDSDSNESSPDSHESINDSGDSDNDSIEGIIDSHECNNDSGDSSDSDRDSIASSPDSHESNNDSHESNNNNDSHESNNNNDSHESNNNNDSHESNNNNNNDNHESNNNNNNDSHESNNNNYGSHESNNNNNDNHESNNNNNNDSHECNNNNNDSHESNNNNYGSHESSLDSHESKNDNNESQNDSKESNNSNSGNSDNNDNVSKNDSKESNNNGNNNNNGSNEMNDQIQINSNKAETENNSENTADNNKTSDGSSDAHKKDDDDDKHNENKENDSEDTSKPLDGRKDENKDINENKDKLTQDVSQSTDPMEAVNKIKAVVKERSKELDEAKKKYHEINRKTADSTKLERRKRDIDFSMPPPPVLQPLNVRMLPDFIQRMITNIPALKNVMSPDERGESNYPDENGPQTYGFHLNNKGPMWNNLPLLNQANYMNDPSNMINSEKQEDYQENDDQDSSNDVSNSGSDDNSLYSDNDSGYNAEPDEEVDKNSDDNSIGVWPNIGAPIIDFNNFKPYNPVKKENDMSNFVNKINKDAEIIEKPKTPLPTQTNIENRYKKNMEKEPKKTPTYTPPPKTKISINKDLKEKIEMSFDNIGKVVPPMITRFEENLVKTAVKNDETPLTYGMKLSGDNGYDLADPGNHYLFGDPLETNKEWNDSSSPATDKFNEYNTEPKNSDERETEANEPRESLLHKDDETPPIVPGNSVANQSQKPSIESENLSEPNKESLDKDKDKSDDKKDNEAVQVALDDLLKKDEFWKWLTKWTAAYISVLNEHVEELVKREVAKQLNKTMSQKNEKEKDKIDTNNKDLINKNETIPNVSTVELANNTNEINDNTTTPEKNIPELKNNTTTPEKNIPELKNNTTTPEKNIPELNNTENIAPEKDKLNINKISPDGHKSNRTTPANAHTIYGNAIDSNHVTNIFIFYPNAEHNGTAKDIEDILGNKNNNVVVLGTPSNGNQESKAPDSGTNSPVDHPKGLYAIDPRKDIISNASEVTIQDPETTKNNQSSTADIPTNTKNENSSATIKADTGNNAESNDNATTLDNGTTKDNGTIVANDNTANNNGTTKDNGPIVANDNTANNNGTTKDNGPIVANDNTANNNGTTKDNGTIVANDNTANNNGTTVTANSNATDATSANNNATDTAAGNTLVPNKSTATK